MQDLADRIRDIPNFPKPGILFKDITTLLADADAFRRTVRALADRYRDRNIERVVAIEARGFIFGAALAYELGVGFVPVRKPKKLPYKTRSASYELEYGTDTLEIHEDAVSPGQRVVIVDDLLATGGTVRAVAGLVRDMGGVIEECAFVIELDFLNGRAKLDGVPIHSLIHF